VPGKAVASGTPEEQNKAKILSLVWDFDRDPAGNAWLIRDFVAARPKALYDVAMELLVMKNETHGADYVISLLATGDQLLKALCDPRVNREQALRLGRAAAQKDPRVDVLLGRHLADRAYTITSASCPPELQRILEVIAEISDGSRILPFLMTLARQPNPHVHSKALLLIGRVSRNAKWLQNRLSDPDPRARANAIESVWGLDAPEIRDLLRGLLQDADNRAAGNALVGLYQLGDCAAVSALYEMCAHESYRFRATAAWAIGEVGDPRFRKQLARLVGESNPLVRARAFSALTRMRTAERNVSDREWQVCAAASGTATAEQWQCFVHVTSADRQEIPVLLPTQLVPFENGEPVMRYSAECREISEVTSIAWLAPGTEDAHGSRWGRGVTACLEWKRIADAWAFLRYGSASSPGQKDESAESGRFQFLSKTAALEPHLYRAPDVERCPSLTQAIRKAAQSENTPARGKRQIVLTNLSPPGEESSQFQFLATVLQTAHSSLHVLSLVPHAALESLAKASQGSFELVRSAEEISSGLMHVYLRVIARYLVRYRPPAGIAERTPRMAVYGPNRWAEADVLA
jgi:hypothetical protein